MKTARGIGIPRALAHSKISTLLPLGGNLNLLHPNLVHTSEFKRLGERLQNRRS